MANKINRTDIYPNTTPADGDYVLGVDVSDTSNDANGEVATFRINDILSKQHNHTSEDISDLFAPYPTVADFLASVEPSRGVGSIWEGGGFRYEEVASGGDVTNAAGVQFDVLKTPDSEKPAIAYATASPADYADPINRALNGGGTVNLPAGTYPITQAIVMPSNSQLLGQGGGSTIISAAANTHNAIEIGDGSGTVRKTKIAGMDITCAAGSFGTANSGIEWKSAGPNHELSDVYVTGFKYNIKGIDALFSTLFRRVRAVGGDFNWHFNGTTSILDLTFDNCYSAEASSKELLLYACRNFVFNGLNVGSTGKQIADIALNSYGVIFNGPNFELESGSYDSGTNIINIASGSNVTLNMPLFAGADAAGTSYLVSASGSSQVHIFSPSIINEGSNITHLRTLNTSEVSIYGENDFTSYSESSTQKVILAWDAMRNAPIAKGLATVTASASGVNVDTGITSGTNNKLVCVQIVQDGDASILAAIPQVVDRPSTGGNIKLRFISLVDGTEITSGSFPVQFWVYDQ